MLEGMVFLLVWMGFPVIWWNLLRIAKVRLNKISIPSVLIIFIGVFQYFGIPALYFKVDKYRVAEVERPELMLNLFLLSSAVITFLIFGYILSRYILGSKFNAKTLSSYYSQPEVVSRRDIQCSLIIFVLGALGLVLYFIGIGWENTALFRYTGLSSSGEEGMVLRSNMGNAFEGRYYIYKFFMRDLLTVGSISLFLIYLSNRSALSMIVFMVSFLACVFSLLLAAEKGPIVQYAISLGFGYLIITKNGYFSIRQVVTVVIILAVLISVAYMVFMGAQSPLEGLLQGASRAFTGQIQPLYHYLEIFPEEVDYLYGRSMPNPMGLLSFEHYNLTVEVMNIVQPWHLEKGVVGTMPTFFWGELYANYSYVGVFLIPSVVGFAVCLVGDIIDRIKPTPVLISIMIWFAMHIKNLAITSLSNYMLDFYSFSMIIILLFAAFYSGEGRLCYKRKACYL